MIEHYYLFDPLQFKEFGFSFFEGNDFSVKYQLTEHFKFFFDYLYIPFGPIASSEEGFQGFLDWIRSYKLCKTKVDLPLILNTKKRDEIVLSLEGIGFHKDNYFLDEETIIVTSSDYKPTSNAKRNMKAAEGQFIVERSNTILSDQVIEDIFRVYKAGATSKGFVPEKKEAFQKINENSVSVIARNKMDGGIEGYLLGYKSMIETDVSFKSITYIVFSSFTSLGRQNKLGYYLRDEFCRYCFELGCDLVDFHGASRTKARSYTEFKKEFGGEFYQLGGSFSKLSII